MPPTTTIQQREIPGGPRSAIVRNYSFEAIGEMDVAFRAALPPVPPFAVGVSIQVAPVGPDIRTLALATQDQVFVLSFPPPPTAAQKKALRSAAPSTAQKKALRNLLKVRYLTGFELPYTIALLAHVLGSDVYGYDLSTLKNEDIMMPGDFLHSKNVSVSARSINELWDGGISRRRDVDSSGTPEPNYALRA